MKIKIITSEEQGYIARAEKIVDLYNEASEKPFNEKLNLQRPESTKIIYAEHDSGGVLLDYHSNYKVYRVMFAAFDKKNRGKGLLKACLEVLKKEELDIPLVEIGDDNEISLWQKLGYIFLGADGMSIVATNRKLEFINYDSITKL